MHLHKFTKAQKLAFLALTKKMISVDNQIHINESTYYTMIQSEMGLEGEVHIEDKPVPELIAPFNNRMTGVWLLQELIGVGYIDENLASEEQQLIQDIAKRLGFTPDEVEEIRQLVVRTKELIRETNELIRRR